MKLVHWQPQSKDSALCLICHADTALSGSVRIEIVSGDSESIGESYVGIICKGCKDAYGIEHLLLE